MTVGEGNVVGTGGDAEETALTVFKGVDNVPAAALVQDDASSATTTTNDVDGGDVTRGGDGGDFSVAVVAEADAAVIAGPVRGGEEGGDDGETTKRAWVINGATAGGLGYEGSGGNGGGAGERAPTRPTF